MFVSLQELTMKRDRLASILRGMEEAQREMNKAKDQGNFNSAMAMSWAAVLLAADIVKRGLSEGNKQAAFGFAAFDKGVAEADKLLVAFGRAPMAKKADALQSLDPNLRNVNGWVDQVSQVRGWLGKAGLKEDKHLALVLDIVTDMTQDTLLMLQAGQDQTRNWNNATMAISRASQQIDKVKLALRKLDGAIAKWLLEFDRVAGRFPTA
jgi:hypothetical protein